ncbi:3-hydroxyacyl-CoA dehydrogenase [Palleronia marisminoris]|uniref:Fatty acid oxidation complex subunit alpha n=1 Tax=Palleronia marisminoris TaxID=315423 RepID=A0A1Y5T4M2_9RHOB|nr:3-hydroxyacyl-CoA dehydrogenase NAD-binding domain-containing protein [Palleronia marisminoris]SFH17075.1 3-hydroxyacyl-CoA dehydrogenase [Palleronia marisminoris]SLN55854.1 Fatty acid oxidation complex subunit alpha [Palleronia marisminoris]
MSDTVRYDREGAVAIVTVDNPPVNALGHAVRQALVAAFDRFEADDAEIAVLTGAGRLFLGGADISEFGKPPAEPSLPDVIGRIERCAKPVVAAIHGAALGGGLEVAMGCHYRVALTGTKLGLPEVTLGLIPGAGGTQRAPRLMGLDAAVELMTTGKPIEPEKAQVYGLIDRVVSVDEPRLAGIAYAEQLLAEGATTRPTRDLPAPDAPKRDLETWRELLEQRHMGEIAQNRAAEAAFRTLDTPFDEGMAAEREAFLDLIKSRQSDALRHAFFLERQVSRLPELKGVEPREIASVGVIGGGTMGAGIATACLLAGLSVTLIETDAVRAEKAYLTVSKNLDGAVERGKMSEDARRAADLTTTVEYEALSEADIVVEAVFESMDVKRQVFAQLDGLMKQGAVLATNTSYLDVNQIADATGRPQDVIGLHFFSPAHVMRLVEVVVADKTAPEVTATAFALAKKLKKVAVRSGVCDGFIGNRILSHYRAAATEMVLKGASPYQIDAAIERFGFKMGPYKVADLAGLDIGHATRARKGPQPGEVNPDWDDRLNEMGRLGRKTGRGYYTYDDGTKEDPEVPQIIEDIRAAKGIEPRDFNETELVERYMTAMVNEAAKVVGEGIAKRPLDVDAVLLFGYGFPRFRGGPMKYADHVGLRVISDRIDRYAAENPEFWQKAPLIAELVERDGTFEELNT